MQKNVTQTAITVRMIFIFFFLVDRFEDFLSYVPSPVLLIAVDQNIGVSVVHIAVAVRLL